MKDSERNDEQADDRDNSTAITVTDANGNGAADEGREYASGSHHIIIFKVYRLLFALHLHPRQHF